MAKMLEAISSRSASSVVIPENSVLNFASPVWRFAPASSTTDAPLVWVPLLRTKTLVTLTRPYLGAHEARELRILAIALGQVSARRRFPLVV